MQRLEDGWSTDYGEPGNLNLPTGLDTTTCHKSRGRVSPDGRFVLVFDIQTPKESISPAILHFMGVHWTVSISLVRPAPHLPVHHLCRSVLSTMWPLPSGILRKVMKSMFYLVDVLSQRLWEDFSLRSQPTLSSRQIPHRCGSERELLAMWQSFCNLKGR